MIDTHCHLTYKPLSEDIEGVLSRAREAGVRTIIVPATDSAQSAAALREAEAQDGLYAMVGVHPDHAGEALEEGFDWLNSLVPSAKLVAIGEVGLDYFRTPVEALETRAQQHEVFRFFLEYAKKVALPLVLHVRDAHEDALRLYTECAAGIPAVVHCFSDSLEVAYSWLDAGAYISFTNLSTYSKTVAGREVVASVPWDRFFLETDAPYLPPAHRRGTVCEPSDVRFVYEFVSEVRGVPIDEVQERVAENASRFFRISLP